MLPISSISHALPPQSMLQSGAIGSPEAMPLRIPEVDSTGKPAEMAPSQGAGDSFGSLLGKMVQEVNARQNVATDTVNSLQSGGDASLHQAVIAMEEASVSFQLMVEVRNKLLESYQEMMRMQI